MAITNVPIWMDHYQALGVMDSRGYVLKLDGSTIYAGTAWKRPGTSQPEVLINDIAAPYLSQNADCLDPENGDQYYPADIIRNFLLYDADGVTRIGNDFVCFLKWEDDARNVIGRDWAHDYINGHIAAGMPIVFTLYNNQALTYDGGAATYVRARRSSQITSENVLAYSAPGNYAFTPDFVAADEWITVNGHRFDRVDECHNYALYYVNAYGAWDFLLIEGAVHEGRRYERHELKRVHNNASVKSRGIWNYANEVRKTWTLNSGWISDEGAARMHHLIGSTLVYLYDIAAQTFRPVNVTDTEVTARKYEQEGALLNYTINVEEGREGLRR